jgi:hypothetical protein
MGGVKQQHTSNGTKEEQQQQQHKSLRASEGTQFASLQVLRIRSLFICVQIEEQRGPVCNPYEVQCSISHGLQTGSLFFVNLHTDEKASDAWDWSSCKL